MKQNFDLRRRSAKSSWTAPSKLAGLAIALCGLAGCAQPTNPAPPATPAVGMESTESLNKRFQVGCQPEDLREWALGGSFCDGI